MNNRNAKNSFVCMAAMLAIGIVLLVGIPSVSFAYLPGCNFLNGTSQSMVVNENSASIDISSMLTVVARTSGGTVTWTTTVAPSNGTLLAGYVYSAPSGVATHTITPTGLTYTPAPGFVGTDSFVVNAEYYGPYGSNTTIYVTVVSPSYIYISSGTTVSVTGDVAVSTSADSFINDGTYIDNAGSFNVLSVLNFSGSGVTHFDSLTINTPSGTSLINTLVSVYGTAIIGAGSAVNANDSLFIRSDSGSATLINNGSLTGKVQGLIATASATTGGCPSYTSNLSLNVSGTEMAYQWQSSPDSSTWTDVSGATTATYTATVTANNYYRCNLATLNTSFAQSTPGLLLGFTGVTPTITLGANPSITAGTTTASLPYTATTGSPTSYSIIYNSAAHTAGLTDVPATSLTASTILLAVPSAILPGAYTGSVTVTNGCNSLPVVFTLTVTPGFTNTAPTFNGSATQSLTVCENSVATSINSLFITTDPDAAQTETYSVTVAPANGTLAGFPATASSGSSSITPTGLTYTPTTGYSGTDAFTVQVADGAGGVATTVITVTVNPTPDIAAVTSQAVCNNTATTAVSFTGSVTGTTYSWTNNAASIGLAASGTGNIAAFTATVTGSSPAVATVTVNPSANGCTGTSVTFNYTVNPTPTVATLSPSLQIACNGFPTSSVVPTGSSVSGTVYTWTNSRSGNGLATSGTGVIPSFTAVNISFPQQVSTVTVTPIANGCSGISTKEIYGINPTPTVSPVSDKIYCPGTSVPTTTFTGSFGSGGGYVWTSDNTAVGIASATGTQSVTAFTATSSAPAVTNFTITPNVRISGTTCYGTPTTFSMTVDPQTSITLGANPSVTLGTTSANLPYTATTGSPTTYSITYSPAAISAGFVNVTAATMPSSSPILLTVPSAAATGAYTGSVTVTNGCNSLPMAFTVSVIPDNTAPTFNGGASQTLTVCGNSGSNLINSLLVATDLDLSQTETWSIATSPAHGSLSGFDTTAASGGTAITPAGLSYTPNTGFSGADTFAVQIADGLGGVDTTVIAVTVNPSPNVSGYSNQAVCNGVSTTAVNFTSSISGTTYSWANTNTSIGLSATGTGNIASFIATNSTISIEIATITVTPSANSCTGTPQAFTIMVNPTPVVDSVSSATICNGSPASVSFAGPVSGTTYSWTNTNTSIGLTASGTGDISFAGVNTGSIALTASLTVTATANGCPGNSKNFTITVNPTPDVSGYSNQNVCHYNQSLPIDFTGSVSGTTFSWTNNNTAINLGASGIGNIAAFTAINTTASPITATVIVTPSANGCNGTPQSFTITVNPDPTIAPVADQTVCNNTATTAIDFSADVAGTTYTWINYLPGIGLASSGSGNIAAFTAANSGTSAATAIITVMPTANGCTGSSEDFTISVNPTPDVDGYTNQAICNNSSTAAITFSSSVSGTTFAWTNNNTSIGLAGSGSGNISSFLATDITNAIHTATITVTPSANSCNGIPQSFMITVDPTPVVDAVSSTTICNGGPVSVSFGGPVSGTAYAWTNSNTTIGLATSGTGDISLFGVNTGSAVETASLTVTASANGCTGNSENFTITVNPAPTVTSVTNQTLCAGSSSAAITFTGAVSGTTYSWTNNNSSIGLTTSGTGNIASFTATNTTGGIETATITVTPSANGCTGIPDTFTIKVNPTPTVTGYANQTLCNNATTSAITFSGPVSGTTYTWTNSNSSIGLATSGTGNIASFTATNTGTVAVTATITVTPYANGCVGTSHVMTITVDPTPSVAAITNQTLCNNNSSTAIVFGSSVSGTTYSWSNSNSSIGLASTGTGNIASFTATNTTSGIEVATVTVAPSASTCGGSAQSFTITVDPTPTVNAVSGQTLCNTAATTAINYTGAVTGTIYTWTNSSSTIGLATSGTGNINAFTASNTTTAIEIATVTVTPSANGCTGSDQHFTITVDPTPTVAAVSSQTLCNNATVSAVTFGSSVTGTTYSWTNSNTSIGLASSGSGNIASFTATNGSSSIDSSIIVFTPSANGCTGTSDSFNIIVDPTPNVTVPADETYCNSVSSGTMSFSGLVSGTIYSWTNNNTSVGLAPSGTGDISAFTTTNITDAPTTATITATPSANGCVGYSQRFVITVNPTPLLSTALTPDAICDSTLFSYGPASATPGTSFAWSRGAITGITNATASGSDTVNEILVNSTAAPIAVVYVDTLTANGCVNTQTVTVTVNPKPLLTTTLTPAAICDSTLFTYGPGSATTGTAFTWSRAAIAGIINMAANGTDTINEVLVNITANPLVVIYVDTLKANGCVNTESVAVTVNARPMLSTTLTPAAICDSTVFIYGPSSLTLGTAYTWSRAALPGVSNTAATGTDTINEVLVNTTANPIAVVYVETLTANSCSNTQNVTVTVNPKPLLTTTLSPAAICDSSLFSYLSASLTTGTSYTWSRAVTAGISNAAATGSGAINEQLVNDTTVPVSVIYMDTLHANGCINTEAVTVIVNPLPTLSSTLAPAPVCDSSMFSYIPTSAVGGASFAWARPFTTGIGLLASSGTGNPNEQLINTTNANVVVTYIYTVIANGCSGNPYDVTDTVRPTPKLSTPLSDSICSGMPFSYVPEGTASGIAFTWTRAAIPGISNSAATGNGSIYDTLTNTTAAAVYPVYVYTMNYDGCSFQQDITLKVNAAVGTPVITTAPPHSLCSSTMDQNFGAATLPAAGSRYIWTADNAQVWATGSTGQYSLVNFNISDSVATITLTALATTTLCFSQATYTVAVENNVSELPQVVYGNGQFICLQNDEESYQWGYDDLSTLDSTLLPGEVNQTYINPSPDPTKAYWVMVGHNGCMQKAYKTAPTGVVNVNAGTTDVKIFPNPATETVNVDITTTVAGNMDVELVNILGQRLYMWPVINNKAQINVTSLPGGTYLINCYREGVKIYTAKIIKD